MSQYKMPKLAEQRNRFPDRPKTDIWDKSNMRPIACMAWFPVGKDPFPVSFKFKDDDGVIQAVNNISIHSINIESPASFQVNEYKCKAIICGLMREFKIRYYLKSYEWFVIF